MTTVSHQNGSSSTLGLLTASSIFVGILAYATYYGFDESSMPSLFSASTAENTEVVVPSLVQPGEKGIFASPTLVKADDSVSEISFNEVASNSVEQQSVASALSVLNSVPESLSNNSIKPTDAPRVTKAIAPLPKYSGYPTDDRWTGYMNHRNAANLDGRGYYTGRGYGNGSGRGDSAFDGDGSFDFNMSFKGRARMDADSDFDGSTDFNGYSNYRSSYGYYQQPSIYTQYYQY